MTQTDPLSGDPQSASRGNSVLILVATYLNINPTLGRFQRYSYVYNVRIDVEEAFDNSATIAVGHPDDIDAYCTATTVTSTGVKSPVLGAGIGYDATPREVTLTIAGSPTVGKAVVIVEFYLVPRVN